MSKSDIPLKSLDVLAVVQYAAGLAIKEAIIDGILTYEQAQRISNRADELKNALVDGKIVEIAKDGPAVIRDATAEEEAELGEDDFPLHHKARSTLDI